MNNNFLVVTTFPYELWGTYVDAALESWCLNFPQDIPIVIFGEPDNVEVNKAIEAELKIKGDKYNRCFLFNDSYAKGQQEFLERNKGKDDYKDYRKQLVRFSWKVFAQYEAMQYAVQMKYNHLIWLDADVIANSPVDFNKFIQPDKLLSYLGRKDWDTSETGFIAYNINNGGDTFVQRLHNLYISGQAETFEQTTDAYVFDRVIEEFKAVNKKDIFYNLSEGISGRDVWGSSPLASCFTHYKGPSKFHITQSSKKMNDNEAESTKQLARGSFGIISKNCVSDDVIHENIRRNLQIIPRNNWVNLCEENNTKVVICSAGPSLNPLKIKKLQAEGYRVIAVKHALQKLLNVGVVPWGCILLDPRSHVNDFVEYPHKDVNYFVASMCDPEVAISLFKHGAKLWGYHAVTTNKMLEMIPQGHLCIYGGSATATRAIAVLQAMGYRHFNLQGYDLCYDKKPDLQELNDKGNLKYMEVTIPCDTWGDVQASRTFWTEGQLLAQAQEYKDMILPQVLNGEITVEVEGFGMIPWMHHNLMAAKDYAEYKKQKGKELANGRYIDHAINGSGF